MGLREQLETKDHFIVIERWKDHEFWPCLHKFEYQPLTKHDAKIIIDSMIKSYNRIYNGEIEQYVEDMWQEMFDVWEACRGPKVKTEKPRQPGWVYVLNFDDNKTKIGLSKNPETRKKAIVSGSGYSNENIIYFITYKTKDMNTLESLIHDEFEESRITGEWFNFNSEDLNRCKECNFNKDILGLIQEAKIQCQKSN